MQGLPKKFDQKKILKVIKKKFACNGTIVNDTEMGEVIQLQGDQRKDVQEFLTDKKEGLELDPKTIKVSPTTEFSPIFSRRGVLGVMTYANLALGSRLLSPIIHHAPPATTGRGLSHSQTSLFSLSTTVAGLSDRAYNGASVR